MPIKKKLVLAMLKKEWKALNTGAIIKCTTPFVAEWNQGYADYVLIPKSSSTYRSKHNVAVPAESRFYVLSNDRRRYITLKSLDVKIPKQISMSDNYASYWTIESSEKKSDSLSITDADIKYFNDSVLSVFGDYLRERKSDILVDDMIGELRSAFDELKQKYSK